MKITDEQLLAIAIDLCNSNRADDGLPSLSGDELKSFTEAFNGAGSKSRTDDRSLVIEMVESIVKHLGLREPRDETMVTISMFGPVAGGAACRPAEVPTWVLQQANEIAKYMGQRTMGLWKIDGIQKRID